MKKSDLKQKNYLNQKICLIYFFKISILRTPPVICQYIATVLGMITCQLHQNEIENAAGQLEFLAEIHENIGTIPVS